MQVNSTNQFSGSSVRAGFHVQAPNNNDLYFCGIAMATISLELVKVLIFMQYFSHLEKHSNLSKTAMHWLNKQITNSSDVCMDIY